MCFLLRSRRFSSSISHTEPYYMIYVDRREQLDQLEVWVEVSDEVFSDEIRKLESLEREIRKGN